MMQDRYAEEAPDRPGSNVDQTEQERLLNHIACVILVIACNCMNIAAPQSLQRRTKGAQHTSYKGFDFVRRHIQSNGIEIVAQVQHCVRGPAIVPTAEHIVQHHRGGALDTAAFTYIADGNNGQRVPFRWMGSIGCAAPGNESANSPTETDGKEITRSRH
jgi:hypothetical protein